MHFRHAQGRHPEERSIPISTAIFADLGKAYAKAVKAFYDAGCRYLQFDDTAWAYLCSPAEMAAARERMPMADNLPQIYQDMINTALAAKPADMTITTHVCRGNFKSTWVAEGGYEPVAERLLGGGELRRLFPRIRHRPRRRLRAAALPAEGRQDRRARPRHLEERHAGEEGRPSSAASTRRRSSRRSSSSRCRRNAASPRPRKATSSPRTSSGRSSG